MGGTKRKIPIEKIEKKGVRSVAFTKRRNGIFSKATELCKSGAHIAILATPPSDKSTVPFYSFGHPSVDVVVDAFLENRCPQMIMVANGSSVSGDQTSSQRVLRGEMGREDGGSCSSSSISLERNNGCLVHKMKKPWLGLGFWWEEEFEKYEKTKDLRDVIRGMIRLKNNVTLRLMSTLKNHLTASRGVEIIASASRFQNDSLMNTSFVASMEEGQKDTAGYASTEVALNKREDEDENDFLSEPHPGEPSSRTDQSVSENFRALMRFEDSLMTNSVLFSVGNTI